MEALKLGQKAKDKITGFVGIITGRADYLYGCTNYCLIPAISKDGKLEEGKWFDEGRIEIIGDGVLPSSVKGRKNGGPQSDAPKVF